MTDPRIIDTTTEDGREFLTAMLIREGEDVILIHPDGTQWQFLNGKLVIVPAPEE